MPKLKSVKVSIKLPYIGGVEGTWEPDRAQRSAAWEMYVELVTRISTVELGPDEGLLREALSSLYTLFSTTRDIMRKYGPSVAKSKGKDGISFGYLAVAVLNTVLRPVLARWHPILLDYESKKKSNISPMDHEKRWSKSEELRQVLEKTRGTLTDYADILAKVAGVPPLTLKKESR